MQQPESPSEKAFPELSLEELEDLKHHIVSEIITNIRAERGFLSTSTIPLSQIDHSQIPFHKNFVLQVREILIRYLSESDLKKLLRVNVSDGDREKQLNAWLRVYAKLLKDAVYDGGLEFADTDADAFDKIIGGSLKEVWDYYNNKALTPNQRIKRLEAQTEKLTNHVSNLELELKEARQEVSALVSKLIEAGFIPPRKDKN